MSKSISRQEKVKVLSMPVINPDAAGIDVSATMHVAAVGAGITVEPVRVFGAFTEDLYQLAGWLKQCNVTTVAMESTGVYWQQLYLVLVEQGFEVALVNARHVKNVTGKKTDMSDAQWLQQLHSCGLLKSSFLPDELTGSVRSLTRHRKRLLEHSSTYVLRMQKALELMNVKIHGVISDLMGKTGRAMVEAILRGERKAEQLLQYVDPRIQADPEKLRKSLVGNWRDEHLFLLEENYRMYEFVQQRVQRCDQQIERYLQQMAAQQAEGVIEALPTCEDESKKKAQKEGEELSGL
jgi:transposase